MNLGRPPLSTNPTFMLDKNTLTSEFEDSISRKQESASELLDLMEENIFTLLGDIRDFRLHLMRIESVREKMSA